MGEVKNTPYIRFKGYSGDWEENYLGQLAKITTGKSNRQDSGLDGKYTFFDRSDDIRRSSIYLFDCEAIIVAGEGSDFVPKYFVGKFDLHQRTYAIMNFDKLAGKFLHYYIYLFRKHFLNYAVGSTVKSLRLPMFKEMLVKYPSNLEQIKIGTFFKNLDDQITLKQRKLDKMVTLKKAMLEKMFPKEGADEPEIRFKGFSGAWDARGLLDHFEKIIDFRGRTPKKLGLDWSNSGYLALSALNVKNGYIDFSVDAHFGNQELYDKWMLGNELHKNQVLFTTEAPMGNVAQVPDEKKYILSQRTIAFVVKESLIDENFLAVCLRSPKIFEKLTSLSSGGTAQGVSQKSLSSLHLVIPHDLDEQRAIGSYFKKLDEFISLQKIELIKLKQIKSSCLEKMFV